MVVREQAAPLLGAPACEALAQFEAPVTEPRAEPGPGPWHQCLLCLVPQHDRAATRANEAGRTVDDELEQRCQVKLAGDLTRDVLKRFKAAGAIGEGVGKVLTL